MKQTNTIKAENLPMEETGSNAGTTPPTVAVARAATVYVPEPEQLLPAKRQGGICKPGLQQLTCQELELAIQNQLSEEDNHTKAAGVAALRAGVLFHYYKQTLNGKKADFWAQCESKFGVSRMTISKKMRLAVIWAREKGADETTLLALANAIDLNDTENPAIQLAFDFIGDQTTTDMYRKHNLVSAGPKGGDNTPRDPSTGKPIRAPRRTKAAINKDSFTALARVTMGNLSAAVTQALTDSLETDEGTLFAWSHLTKNNLGEDELEKLVNDMTDLLKQMNATRIARAKLAKK